MQVRFPRWDFGDVRPHWAPNPEFAQRFNAFSSVPAHIEPYLLKVMQRARAELPPGEAALLARVDIFMKQEMQHCKQHLAFYRKIAASGYAGMAGVEQRFVDDLNRFLNEKSLRFNCAYAEGFEAMSAIAVTDMFEHLDPLLEGADPSVVDLWKWHLAEEYEHREVAHDVYHALFGGNRLFAYLYRIYGFFYAATHIVAHTRRVARYLLAVDRAGMTPGQRTASVAREKAARRAGSRRVFSHLRDILSPFSDPAKRAAPRGVEAYLGDFGGPVAAG